MNGILELDTKLFLFLNNLGSSEFDTLWMLISGKFTWIPLYIIFLYLLHKNFNWKGLLYMILFIVLGVTISDQLSTIFKYGFERLRPCHNPNLENIMREVQCGGQFGFFSAHASNTFFVASFVAMMLKHKYGVFALFLFIWATIVSYSRIYLGVHYPLDILVGACIGTILGMFFSFLSKKVIEKNKVKVE